MVNILHTIKNRKLVILVLIVLVLTLFPTQEIQATLNYFTIVALPDTQNYSLENANIFSAQTQWIVNNKDAENIIFVIHEGDIVYNAYEDVQWVRAKNAINTLRNANIPYSVLPGNHDIIWATKDFSYFNSNFPYTSFSSYSWYGGHFPSNGNQNNYALISTGLGKFLILNIGVCPSVATYDWANGVLSEYPNEKVIVATHGYIDSSGDKSPADNVGGSGLWENVIRKHANIFMVICGHLNGECSSMDIGDMGNTIHNLLISHLELIQAEDVGFLRLYRFYPAMDMVEAITYSPYLNQYKTDWDSQFAFDLVGQPIPITVRLFDTSVSLDCKNIEEEVVKEPSIMFNGSVNIGLSGTITLRPIGMASGTYHVVVFGSHSLVNLKKNVEIINDLPINMGALLEGNADGDYRVFMGDFGILAHAYRSEPGDDNWDERADFNYDSKVYSEDFAILQVNFAKLSPILVGN